MVLFAVTHKKTSGNGFLCQSAHCNHILLNPKDIRFVIFITQPKENKQKLETCECKLENENVPGNVYLCMLYTYLVTEIVKKNSSRRTLVH